GQFAMRFTVADQLNDSVTEAAIDAFRIDDVRCVAPTWNTYGVGCTSGASAPNLQNLSLPNLGSTFVVRAAGLDAGPTAMIVGLASVSTPISIPEFATGCTLLARADLLQVLTTVSGQAIYGLGIPANSA